MAYCIKCGTQLPDNATFCPSCGEKSFGGVSTNQNNSSSNYNSSDYNSSNNSGYANNGYQQSGHTFEKGAADFTDAFNRFNNTADTTSEYSQEDINDTMGISVLAYLSWLVLIPLLCERGRKSKFARFHANQGLTLAIIETVYGIFEGLVTGILSIASWHLAHVVGILLGLVNIVFVILLIIGIVNVASGKAKELPIIGKIRLIKY